MADCMLGMVARMGPAGRHRLRHRRHGRRPRGQRRFRRGGPPRGSRRGRGVLRGGHPPGPH
eukprot:6987517-Lingulodinium_polyedra.AAC.1